MDFIVGAMLASTFYWLFVSGSFAEILLMLVAMQKGSARYFWRLEDVLLGFYAANCSLLGLLLQSFLSSAN